MPPYSEPELAYMFEFKKDKANKNQDHCLDALREQLMCTADIGVLPYVRVRRNERAYPDFPAAPHMCRNFEDIREWARDAQTGREWTAHLYEPQPGDIVLDQIP
jgi:Mycotoxin biosynthesis protein UstYa